MLLGDLQIQMSKYTVENRVQSSLGTSGTSTSGQSLLSTIIRKGQLLVSVSVQESASQKNASNDLT